MDEKLNIMSPFLDKVWEGKMQGLGNDGIIMSESTWTVAMDGKTIKYSSKTPKLNLQSEGYYYWDNAKKEVGFFNINSRGIYLKGHIKKEEDRILKYGIISFKNKELEFKNYYSFTEDGKMLDEWFRKEDGEWKGGHTKELKVIVQ
jgi:hypothetical protein